jgi:hypothetical protein
MGAQSGPLTTGTRSITALSYSPTGVPRIRTGTSAHEAVSPSWSFRRVLSFCEWEIGPHIRATPKVSHSCQWESDPRTRASQNSIKHATLIEPVSRDLLYSMTESKCSPPHVDQNVTKRASASTLAPTGNSSVANYSQEVFPSYTRIAEKVQHCQTNQRVSFVHFVLSR